MFFVHAVDDEGKVVVAREVRRRDLLAFSASRRDWIGATTG
jgi:hypothetical protein